MGTERILVIGGDAAGTSAASRAKRLNPDLDITVLERGRYTSYAACGIPYWIAGDVDSAEQLIARSPEQHRANGLDVRTCTEATSIDLTERVVATRDTTDGSVGQVPFDQLVIATGASPVRPPLPGIDAEGVFGVQTLGDGEAVLAWLAGPGRSDGAAAGRAVVVGGGYIGVEMAEAMARHGLDVTVVDRAPAPMSTLDPDMGSAVATAMESMGIRVLTDVSVERLETDQGRVVAVHCGEERLPADIVVLGMGVRPAAELAAEAGLPIGVSGGIRTDLQMRVPGHDGVWAAGDCVEVVHRVTGAAVHVPLGTHANKQGRVVGSNLGGSYATFPGVVGTAITKVCELEIARTGVSEAQAHAAGFQVVSARIDSTTTAGYFPTAESMAVKVVAERASGRLLGVQIVGRAGSAKRIDAAAVAVWNEMTVSQLEDIDLAYAPPFAPVWDPLLVAARKAAEKVHRG